MRMPLRLGHPVPNWINALLIDGGLRKWIINLPRALKALGLLGSNDYAPRSDCAASAP